VTDPKKQPPETGLHRALDVEIAENLLEVAELRGEMCAAAQAINNKTDRMVAVQEKVERSSQAIARLKTIWSFVAAAIAFLAAVVKDWVFGRK